MPGGGGPDGVAPEDPVIIVSYLHTEKGNETPDYSKPLRGKTRGAATVSTATSQPIWPPYSVRHPAMKGAPYAKSLNRNVTHPPCQDRTAILHIYRTRHNAPPGCRS